MESIDRKVYGSNTCPYCNGVGKIPVAKIPFTDIFIWKECENCNDTGHKHKGFERGEFSHVLLCPKMEPCGYEWRHRKISTPKFECPKCGGKRR